MSLKSSSYSLDFVRDVIRTISTWDVEVGPSRHEMMIAQWHTSAGSKNPERLELTLQSNRYGRVNNKVHIIIFSSSWFLHDEGRINWKISGVLYPTNDPLGIRPDNPSVNFTMIYNVKTRKGTLTIVNDL